MCKDRWLVETRAWAIEERVRDERSRPPHRAVQIAWRLTGQPVGRAIQGVEHAPANAGDKAYLGKINNVRVTEQRPATIRDDHVER